jgi:hypothetical protein
MSTAFAVLAHLSSDGFVDDGRPAGQIQWPGRNYTYKYKVMIPVHRNRSVETVATLLDGANNELLQFTVRAHGHDVTTAGQGTATAWPDFSDDRCPPDVYAAKQGCVGLNAFSSDGATPTGLYELDLNSPEPASDERFYGPYPVNRFVRGLVGNARMVVGGVAVPSTGPMHVRSGILMHTGGWANYSDWTPEKVYTMVYIIKYSIGSGCERRYSSTCR